jgi:dUTP pyrophosphatase
MANAKDNIISMQNEFDRKSKMMEDRNKQIVGNRFTEIMNMIDSTGSEEGIAPIAAILAMPDKDLAMFSEIFLGEMERAMRNSNEALLMAQALNMTGGNIDDLNDAFQELLVEIEKTDELTDAKKDFLKRFFMIIINAIAETEGVAKKIIEIPIELMEDAKVPVYARLGDAGLDIYSTEDIEIGPGETKLIHTGLKVAIPRGYELQVRPKSGISLKTKLRVANTPGTIDSGYRDEVCVIIENLEPKIADIDYDFDERGRTVINSIVHGKSYTIEKGQKIAQFVLNEIVVANFNKVNSIAEVEGEDRGGGFGSTGLK